MIGCGHVASGTVPVLYFVVMSLINERNNPIMCHFDPKRPPYSEVYVVPGNGNVLHHGSSLLPA